MQRIHMLSPETVLKLIKSTNREIDIKPEEQVETTMPTEFNKL